MTELPGKIRVQDAALANMVSIAAILEYLEGREPGAKTAIEARAQEMARALMQEVDHLNRAGGNGDSGEDS
jgi:hypothetical protein